MLDDWRTAPVDDKLRAALGFLEKLTLLPGEVRPEDIMTMRVAGVLDQAILDAIYVCALFNIIDRIADALGFDVPSPAQFARSAKLLLRFGYRV